VERELRVDSTDRTLVGGSRSGEFTIYTLLTQPDLFRRYVMIDSYQAGYLALEDSLFARRKELPKKVFVSSRVPHADVWRFAERLKSRGYKGLEVEYATLNVHHVATMGEGLAKGLKSVFNKPSAYEALLPVAERWPGDSVIARYRALRAQPAVAYNFDEAELIDLGVALAFMQRPADALRVFQLNLEAYPQSGDTYSRIGRTYEQLGDRARAVDAYKEAVRLNGNRFATAALKRLEP
jgi:tetratricopeptide (TPR) repeat protein